MATATLVTFLDLLQVFCQVTAPTEGSFNHPSQHTDTTLLPCALRLIHKRPSEILRDVAVDHRHLPANRLGRSAYVVHRPRDELTRVTDKRAADRRTDSLRGKAPARPHEGRVDIDVVAILVGQDTQEEARLLTILSHAGVVSGDRHQRVLANRDADILSL